MPIAAATAALMRLLTRTVHHDSGHSPVRTRWSITGYIAIAVVRTVLAEETRTNSAIRRPSPMTARTPWVTMAPATFMAPTNSTLSMKVPMMSPVLTRWPIASCPTADPAVRMVASTRVISKGDREPPRRAPPTHTVTKKVTAFTAMLTMSSSRPTRFMSWYRSSSCHAHCLRKVVRSACPGCAYAWARLARSRVSASYQRCLSESLPRSLG